MASLNVNPGSPKGPPDGFVRFGYSPPDPVLIGYKIHLTVTRNDTTVTDCGYDDCVIFDETRTVAQGTAKQRTTFAFPETDEWQAGGGNATAVLIAPDGTEEDNASFTVRAS